MRYFLLIIRNRLQFLYLNLKSFQLKQTKLDKNKAIRHFRIINPRFRSFSLQFKLINSVYNDYHVKPPFPLLTPKNNSCKSQNSLNDIYVCVYACGCVRHFVWVCMRLWLCAIFNKQINNISMSWLGKSRENIFFCMSFSRM